MNCRGISAAVASIPMLAAAERVRSPLVVGIDRIVHLTDGNGLGDDRADRRR
jgi:hypothetical protein